MAEKAFDEAVKRVEAEQKAKAAVDVPNYNKYQFVGVINKDNAENPIKWYARAKPAKAKWSLRLVHVNKDAIIKDLFNQGKIDIFAKYKNAGYSKNVEGEELEEETSPKSLQVRAEYEVRERSWRYVSNVVIFRINNMHASLVVKFLLPPTELYGTFLRSTSSPTRQECIGEKGVFARASTRMEPLCTRRHTATRMAAMEFVVQEPFHSLCKMQPLTRLQNRG